MLKQTLQRVESEGRPALVTIVGPAGVGKSRLDPRAAGPRRGPSRLRLLAHGSVSRVRQHLVFGARRCDQGAVRDPRGRPGGGRGGQGRPRGHGAVRRRRGGPAGPRARRRRFVPRVRPGGALRGVATVPRTDGRAVSARPGARGHPLGRRRVARLHRPRGGLGSGSDPPAHDGATRAVRRSTDVGRWQAQRGLDLPRSAHRRRGGRDDRGSVARRDHRGRPPAHRRAERGEPAVHGGDRPRPDRRRRPARHGGLEVGGGQARRRDRAAAIDPGTHRRSARRPPDHRRRRSCRTRPWSGGCSGPRRCHDSRVTTCRRSATCWAGSA